jgi:hypothetical protein
MASIGNSCFWLIDFWTFQIKCFLYNFALFGQVVSEEKIFRNWPTRKKNCLWWPHLFTDRNDRSNLYKGPSIAPSYHVSVQLAKQFHGRFAINIAHMFWSINKHGHHRQFLFLIGRFLKKSSPLKPLCQMNRNLVGSILGRSSINFREDLP